jgi:hypothetical protein
MEYIRTFALDFEVGEHVELSIENRNGAVTVRGEDTTRARVEVVARVWGEHESEADDQTELIRRNIRCESGRLSIRAPTLPRPQVLFFFGRGPRVDYQITVPRSATGKLLSRSGRIEAEHLTGPLEVEARSGRVGLLDIRRDVRVTSASGSVQAESIGGRLGIESRSGGVRIAGCRGDATVSARSGALQVDSVDGDAKLESRSGSVTVTEAGGALHIKSRSGSVRYEGAVRGPFEIEVMSGSVRMALDASSVFQLEAETMSGSVRSDLPIRDAAPSGRAKAPTVRIRAMSGSIYLGPR